MGAKTVAANRTALARAREARQRLDAERRAQEERQDEATATALVALGELEEIDAVRNGKVAEVGAAVRALIAEEVSAERAAGLLGVDVAEVRRLVKVVAPEPAVANIDARGTAKQSITGSKAVVNLTTDESVDAARRAG